MKIALCLYGNYNNSRDQHAGDKGYEYIKKKFLGYEPDVYIHSYEPSNRFKFHTLFKPIDYQYEDPKDFKLLMQQAGVSQEYFDEGFDRLHSPYYNAKIASSLAFFYSRAQSVRMACMMDEYDWIITSRFDLGTIDANSNRKFKVSLTDFDPNLDPEFIYSAMWDQLNAGLADQWFFSKPENMENLVSIYEYAISEYLKPGSIYEKNVTKHWPDSMLFNNGSSTDPRQFTNIMLTNRINNDLMKYPKWQCINNHLLHKWHLINIDLYKKLKFVVGTL